MLGYLRPSSSWGGVAGAAGCGGAGCMVEQGRRGLAQRESSVVTRASAGRTSERGHKRCARPKKLNIISPKISRYI